MEVTTLFTSLVLHTGVTHLLVNVIYLWLFGCQVEDALGRAEYAFLHRLRHRRRAAPGGRLQPPAAGRRRQRAVGASGAVAGILGLFAIRFYRARIKTLLVVPINLPAIYAIGGWLGVQLFHATNSLVSQEGTGAWAHLGGFTFGVVTGLLMRMSHEAEEEHFEDAQHHLTRGEPEPALRSLHVLEAATGRPARPPAPGESLPPARA